MSKCTNKKLDEFSYEHFTYINQIFGDEAVREIISENFENDEYSFEVEDADSDDSEKGDHHFLYQHLKKKGKKQKKLIRICSVEDGYQNVNVDVNDTLCQSYSLLTYLGYEISFNRIETQMQMIEMYRMLLSDKHFVKALSDVMYPKNNKLWRDFTHPDEPFIVMNKKKILWKINETLDTWENYGYYYFIGNGKCPSVSISKKSKK